MKKARQSEIRPLWEQEATWCIHFNGIMNKTCQLGIAYDAVKGDGAGKGRFPCLKENPTDATRTDLCEQAEYLTEEQARAKADATMARLRARVEREVAGFCGQCDQKVERKAQVGRCIYNEPCGCRVGQGRLPKPQQPATRRML